MSNALRAALDQAALVPDPSLTHPPHLAFPLDVHLVREPEPPKPARAPAPLEPQPALVPAASGPSMGDRMLGVVMVLAAVTGLGMIGAGLLLAVVTLALATL